MMLCKEFNDYDKACEFRDKVDGQTQWSIYKGNKYWIVWYCGAKMVEPQESEE